MKSLLMLWQSLADELASACGTSTTRDFETVTSRTKSEGLSFLTITLPAFCKDFEKSLSQGEIPSGLFRGWKTAKGSRNPLFLGGFLDRVFERETGLLLEKPEIDAIFAVRQLTLMYGKLLVPCSDARVEKAIEGYLECEKEVRRNDAELSSAFMEEFAQASTVLFGGVLQQIDEDIYHGGIIPRHGPGATADRLKGNHKFDQVEWTERLDDVFPFGDFIVANPRHHLDALQSVKFLEPGAERPVRVITVPKTLKTPRIIAVEPTCMQYVQQGLMTKFVQYMESPTLRTIHGVVRINNAHNFVGFTDQVPNQDLARQGSLTGDLATLDLSEASDRVSNQLVRSMLERYPHLSRGVDACRSRKADVPGHGVVRLAKFASMGSALTFPIEAMVFATVATMGIASALKRPVTAKLCEELRGRVRVYGDDIIVPVDHVHEVVRYLETFGFKVNTNKSFWTGKFRESCGEEFYDGERVSIARFRREFPTRPTHVQEIISLVSFRNQIYSLGLWKTTRVLDDKLMKLLKGNFPVVHPNSPALGRVTYSGDYEVHRMSPTLHAPLVKAYVTKAKLPFSRLDGHGALLKWFLKQGDEPFADKDHLERAGRPEAVSMKLGWIQPF